MGVEHTRCFWTERDEYHRIVRQHDRDITVTHPDFIDGRHRGCIIHSHCRWCRTRVTYYEYRGPAIQSI